VQRSQPLAAETARKKYIYPFLFALYPALSLYLRNIREVLPERVLPALGVSLAIAIVFWLLTGIATRQNGKRSLLLFFFLVFFHCYGVYYGGIAGLLPDDSRQLLSHAIALILPGGLMFFLSWAVIRSTSSFATCNRVLQLAVIFLMLWNVMGILVYHGRSFFNQRQLQRRENNQLLKGPHYQANRPDIYCFVLDEFASLESARSLFQYDNSLFAETLRQQGFFVAQNSRSRFRLTEPAIAAILNLGEFDEKKDPFPLIRRNAVAAFLKQHGYRIIEFPLEPAMFMESADQRFHYSLLHASIFFDDFYRLLCERSLLRFLPDRWRRQKTDFSRYYRERVLQVFEKLPEVVKSPGPKFVFAYIFCPHEPFVFDARGGTVPSAYFWDHADPRFYLQQYMFVSRKITEATALILEDSAAPPVILIQSDHGYRGSLRLGKQKSQMPWAEIIKVFNALHLPGTGPKQIEPSLSPLNNFRLIFNQYFGAHYPFLQNP
jgi:hypothetical protein